MQLTKLKETLEIWIAALQHYDFNTLIAKPDSENWSLGIFKVANDKSIFHN
jgi:hypothetical protein